MSKTSIAVLVLVILPAGAGLLYIAFAVAGRALPLGPFLAFWGLILVCDLAAIRVTGGRR